MSLSYNIYLYQGAALLKTNQQIAGFSLNELLKDLMPASLQWERHITGLSSDSRLTQPGDLFIAYARNPDEREQHIEDAIKQGAIAALREADAKTPAHTG